MKYQTERIQTYQTGKPVTDQSIWTMIIMCRMPEVMSGKSLLSEGKLKVEELKEVENYIRAAGTMAFRILYESDDIEQKLCVSGRKDSV